MTVPARVTFLGTGTSHGVPMIGCSCAVCQSSDPHDTRLRPSIFVDVPGQARILVDTGPDLRAQALAHRIARIDGVIYTHGHADHILGLDEVRRFNAIRGGAMPCWADARTWETIHQTFSYVFDGRTREGGGVPAVEEHLIEGPFTIGGVRIQPIPLLHGSAPILGFRFGTFAYLTDCSAIPDLAWPLLAGVETLVVDALRHRRHSTHFSVAEAIEVAARLAPKRTWFTHMCHDLGHAATNAMLPAGVELAYDGLVIDVAADAD